MKNVRAAAIAASFLVAALTGCSRSSTVPEARAPTAPSRNGGLGYGSGNAVPTDTSTNTSAAAPTGTTALEPAIPLRGSAAGWGTAPEISLPKPAAGGSP
jgi:hypothetical protein